MFGKQQLLMVCISDGKSQEGENLILALAIVIIMIIKYIYIYVCIDRVLKAREQTQLYCSAPVRLQRSCRQQIKFCLILSLVLFLQPSLACMPNCGLATSFEDREHLCLPY